MGKEQEHKSKEQRARTQGQRARARRTSKSKDLFYEKIRPARYVISILENTWLAVGGCYEWVPESGHSKQFWDLVA